MKKPVIVLVFVIASLSPGVNSQAHPLSKEECTEGSDFIKNAASSRDNGMGAMAFIGKLGQDFVAIRSFPPALRWFVQDQQDEDFLLEAVVEVFEQPREPIC